MVCTTEDRHLIKAADFLILMFPCSLMRLDHPHTARHPVDLLCNKYRLAHGASGTDDPDRHAVRTVGMKHFSFFLFP